MAPLAPRQNRPRGWAILRVAIEDGLENVRKAVEARGWRAVPLSRAADGEVDAVVCMGLGEDMLGDESVRVDVPVIRCSGLTAEEVLYRLESAPQRPGRV